MFSRRRRQTTGALGTGVQTCSLPIGRLAEWAGPLVASGRVVVAHLGSGASMSALQDGRSVATTMGFTALDGLPMSRRCGAIDPGVLLYLMQQKGMSAEAVSDLLYHDSGLYGVSGVSDDMRDLLASGDPLGKAQCRERVCQNG